MSLKAVVEGRTIIGPDLSEEEWADLKLRHTQGLPVRMACCGAPGHLRVSKKGTQHFYHAVAAGCTGEQESREHLEIKYQIYRICQSEGWETSVEFPAPDRTWIADVYASRDGRKVVFEIQISSLSPEELEGRDRKYRAEGIECFWLLDHFFGQSKDFTSWYDSCLSNDDPQGETIPYIDPALFATGPENHLFIPKGIRSVGLDAKDERLFTTNNQAIPLAVWVREVLKGNYGAYLEESSAAFHRKHRLRTMAAPDLLRFRDFYEKIIREGIYRKKAGRIINTFSGSLKSKALQIKVDEIHAEIAWLEKEYRSYVSEGYGLFLWKKIPGSDTTVPYFRLESASNVKKLQECVKMFEQWEASFEGALRTLERDRRC